MTVPQEFPKDINNKIISLLDIDTRRTLNIYTKLKIPQELSEKITKCLIVQKKRDTFKPYITLNHYKEDDDIILDYIGLLENNARQITKTIQERCAFLIIRDLFVPYTLSSDLSVYIDIGLDKETNQLCYTYIINDININEPIGIKIYRTI